jgi:hypothetical protein
MTADTHQGNDPAGGITLHRGLLENCPAPECQDRAAEQDDEAEPELTEVQEEYSLAKYELFQLAAYGHCTYTDGGGLLTDEGERKQQDYNDRICAAQARFEAAALRKSAEYFQGVLDAVLKPEENSHHWNGVQHVIHGIQAQASHLLKELTNP